MSLEIFPYPPNIKSLQLIRYLKKKKEKKIRSTPHTNCKNKLKIYYRSKYLKCNSLSTTRKQSEYLFELSNGNANYDLKSRGNGRED